MLPDQVPRLCLSPQTLSSLSLAPASPSLGPGVQPSPSQLCASTVLSDSVGSFPHFARTNGPGLGLSDDQNQTFPRILKKSRLSEGQGLLVLFHQALIKNAGPMPGVHRENIASTMIGVKIDFRGKYILDQRQNLSQNFWVKSSIKKKNW